jgi:hypothetical protein
MLQSGLLECLLGQFPCQKVAMWGLGIIINSCGLLIRIRYTLFSRTSNIRTLEPRIVFGVLYYPWTYVIPFPACKVSLPLDLYFTIPRLGTCYHTISHIRLR